MSATPRQGGTPPSAAPAHSSRTLLLLALLFFGPLLAATLLYYGSSWRPTGHTNHGVLIQPPRPLNAALFHGRWSLVYIGAGDCDAQCRRTLYFMRQTHVSLGRLYARVQRVFLATAPCCDRRYLEQAYPGLTTVDLADAQARSWLAGFPAAGRASAIFIVDPNGNLIMRYDTAAQLPAGLHEDLEKLLSLSSIG